MWKNKTQTPVFHCKDMFAALGSTNASKDVKNLVKIFGWDEVLVEIFNKLKNSNKIWITQEEYNLFDDFLALQDNLESELQVYLENHYSLEKKRNFEDISKNLLVSLRVMLDQARIIWILQSQQYLQIDQKKYEFEEFHQEPCELLFQKENKKILRWLRTRKYYLFDGEQETFKSSEKIIFWEHSTFEHFWTLLLSESYYILIHNKRIIKISRESEFIVTDTWWLFVIDNKDHVFHHFDTLHSQYTQNSFTGTSIIQTFKSLNIALLEDSSFSINNQWTTANVKLYNYSKDKIVLQYLHPKLFKLDNKKFYSVSYDLQAFYIYDGENLTTYNKAELEELRFIPEFFYQFLQTKKEA